MKYYLLTTKTATETKSIPPSDVYGDSLICKRALVDAVTSGEYELLGFRQVRL